MDAVSRHSLPPQVAGPPRYILTLSTIKLIWTDLPSPHATTSTSQSQATSDILPIAKVRVIWWGEESPGVVIQPHIIGGGVRTALPASLPTKPSVSLPKNGSRSNSSPPESTTGNTVSYSVRCGKQQFAAYLRDMGTLPLQIVTNADSQRPVGVATIKDVYLLAEKDNHSINGFFPIISVQQSPSGARTALGRKLGELHIVMSLESLHEMQHQPSMHAARLLAIPHQEIDLSDLPAADHGPPPFGTPQQALTTLDLETDVQDLGDLYASVTKSADATPLNICVAV
ncbi:hypothetical protein SeLEV6574_g02632 [Synchytrium endobioticum]|uniref:C2CD3 N-terminal C2 domain-containing protein n=1 Tax=Synchytrium endobioticum TaxID=286115 RepID=A0A507D7N1_9FUNG|nr:hypothetical protein SeLEV6574_g02632 [Synchytrium endobioticum]